jgi:fructokinase
MIGLGEVLWDILPSGKVLGGAPANFAYMTNVLGDEGIVASRVGNDELGREACEVIQRRGLNASYLQYDNEHQTGTAAVSIDAAGQPNFTIREPVAWDFLHWTSGWEELSNRADVVCFGSLAQRPQLQSSLSCETRQRKRYESVTLIYDSRSTTKTYYESRSDMHRSSN